MRMGTGWIGDLNDVAVLPAIRVWISRKNLNVGSLSFGFCCIYSQTPIALLDHRRVSLSIRSEAHHQLRNTYRQGFILVGVPRMPCLPVGMGKPLHQGVLSRCRNTWRNQLTRQDFIPVAMPHRLLFGRQARKQLFVDDVLDAHDLRFFGITVEDDALDNILIQDGAVVMRFHLHIRMAVVEVETVEVSVDSLNGRLGLQCRRSSFKQLSLC